ncbi:class I SAM-dependent methyltransferase [Schaalia sp. lx-100]|uniref:class I SAM-dependent methyltransferase n=1 Tax=Schaalia sp. lx-100 TaxID=2899081 RepID=UPI001E5C6D3A|nr:class I SAM-dependent methyltransferase [Schaalia sp. lx-100]MCD4557812.1 class I SAM-dependent methyltransferase [Schaalia sp. lx-100]
MSAPETHVINPFTRANSVYAKVRPAYPDSAIDYLCQNVKQLQVTEHEASQETQENTSLLRPAPSHMPVAIDLGAGTGKMTDLLCERGFSVHAVEPAQAMREQICPHPHVRIHSGSAEKTGLPDQCADLVVAAQAWHWFDESAATQEAARLLKTSGVLAVVFNQMDVSHPWVHRLTRIMRSGDVHRIDRPPHVGQNFTAPHLHVVNWTDTLTPDQLMALGRTRSSWLKQNEQGRQRMQENLRWYIHDHLGYSAHDPVTLPYMTLVWVAQKITE